MMSSSSASFNQLISPGLQQTFEVGVNYSEGRSFMGEGRGLQVSFDEVINEQPRFLKTDEKEPDTCVLELNN